MSHDLDRVGEAITHYGPTTLLITVNAAERPHSVPVVVQWAGGNALVSIAAASATVSNLLERPFATLVWPVGEHGRHLIVDALGDVVGDTVIMTPTRAVLHGLGGAAEPGIEGQCGGNCEVLYEM